MVKIGTMTGTEIAANLLQQPEALAWLADLIVDQIDIGVAVTAPEVLELAGLISDVFSEGLHVGMRGDLVEMYPDAMPSAPQV
tara:strand:- start:501 stop:749 length:249 start_codon:yes stop_codon:yes gene_type:complete